MSKYNFVRNVSEYKSDRALHDLRKWPLLDNNYLLIGSGLQCRSQEGGGGAFS